MPLQGIRRNSTHLQARGVRTAGLKAINLIKERLKVDHYAIAQHRGGVLGQNAGRQELQLVFFAAYHDGMAGVFGGALAPTICLMLLENTGTAMSVPVYLGITLLLALFALRIPSL